MIQTLKNYTKLTNDIKFEKNQLTKKQNSAKFKI